ncbi:(2Fe-2S)-binding protein [Halomonas sp. MCCC 1A17488]|uniref:(2Fe-2S)-binding protein n=1 Tax=Halomonadaceae TaxID=28256 RepID=UPI0018D240EA|nr:MULTISPECIES: (2Fe-2S)-binding protein [unclassified Halomonas]MCE8015793.1 (2Fe-2S)-binding protein [Halomonas sp. MCCC 1A17488]MCG3239126.1 (2Fe-2S)-binding protein [Halomonas sp. MCCC 1A17488]QPP50931.1 (2Fe-2S)-binding protein [Halomonas sp. SS10-MC5]
MPNASRFERLPTRSFDPVTVFVEGHAIEVDSHDTAAAAVLAAGLMPSRTTPASGSKRAPYCLMGACFECLLVIDGVANQQGCLVRVQDRMQIHRQVGARDIHEPPREATT